MRRLHGRDLAERNRGAARGLNQYLCGDRFTMADISIGYAIMLARYAGLRGQTIVVVSWKQYRDHDLTGKCFRFVAGKNQENGFVPAMPVLGKGDR